MTAPAALSSLVAYRIVYYLVPFLVAFAMLVANELVVRREHVGRVLRGAHASFAPVVPWLAALGAVVAGAVLLVSGATPAEAERLHVLRRVVPLAVLEASHLVGSLVGTALLLLARGLARRLDGAWVLAVALLAAGVVASLVKGLDWEEATLLARAPPRAAPVPAPVLPAQLAARRAAQRVRGSSPSPRSSPPRSGSGSSPTATSSTRATLSSSFAFHADVPRFLRASVRAAPRSVALYGVAALLRPRRAGAGAARPRTELARARPLVDARAGVARRTRRSSATRRSSSLRRDDAFLMYGVEGRSWVALGDPVGPGRAPRPSSRGASASCRDRHDGWACFYQVGPSRLPRYLDMGLALFRLGEEAIVPLATFSLEGSDAARAPPVVPPRASATGSRFEVVPAEGVPPLLPELRAHLGRVARREERAREGLLASAYFDERYLVRGAGRARAHAAPASSAFANLWTSAEPRASSPSTSCATCPSAPRGTHGLPVRLDRMMWGRAQGYRAFSLGMAPLSGLEDRALAPLWTKLGARLYRHGEYFYNFQGLRQYKEKFAPEWRPRYLAAPGGLRLPRVLANVAALVSRGLKGVVSR